MPRRVAVAESAPDAAFELTPDHQFLWEGHAIACLRRGRSVLRPHVVVSGSEFLDGAQRERLRVRLQRWIDEAVRRDLAPLFDAVARAATDPETRGMLHRLQEALGVIPGDGSGTDHAMRRSLRSQGVVAGRFGLFLPAVLKPRPAGMRARLWALSHSAPMPDLPGVGLVSLVPPSGWPAGFAESMGWLDAGATLIRLDVAERVFAELARVARHGAIALPSGLASRFSVQAATLPIVLRRLGFRLLPGGGLAPGMYGPPAPPMLLAPRRRRPPAAEARVEPREHGPFAALAALRR